VLAGLAELLLRSELRLALEADLARRLAACTRAARGIAARVTAATGRANTHFSLERTRMSLPGVTECSLSRMGCQRKSRA
jgi:hypothetical protein